MWERQVPAGEMYALSAFKQLRRKWMLFSRCYGVVVVALGALLAATSSPEIGGVLIALGLFLGVWPDIAMRRARAVSIRRAGGDTVTMVITEDALRVSSPNWSNSVNWRGVTRIVERDERWLVYLTKRNAIPVPKSAFTDAEQAQLRDFLSTRGTNRPTEPSPA